MRMDVVLLHLENQYSQCNVCGININNKLPLVSTYYVQTLHVPYIIASWHY